MQIITARQVGRVEVSVGDDPSVDVPSSEHTDRGPGNRQHGNTMHHSLKMGCLISCLRSRRPSVKSVCQTLALDVQVSRFQLTRCPASGHFVQPILETNLASSSKLGRTAAIAHIRRSLASVSNAFVQRALRLSVLRPALEMG